MVLTLNHSTDMTERRQQVKRLNLQMKQGEFYMETLSHFRKIKTKAESEAVQTKFEHPNNEVFCPRCGNLLIHYEVGNSEAVECSTPECLYAGRRGI